MFSCQDIFNPTQNCSKSYHTYFWEEKLNNKNINNFFCRFSYVSCSFESLKVCFFFSLYCVKLSIFLSRNLSGESSRQFRDLCVYRKLSIAFFVMWYFECDPMPNIFKSATNPPLLSRVHLSFFTLVHSHFFSLFPSTLFLDVSATDEEYTHKKKESGKRLNQVTQCKKKLFNAHPYWALLLLFMEPS